MEPRYDVVHVYHRIHCSRLAESLLYFSGPNYTNANLMDGKRKQISRTVLVLGYISILAMNLPHQEIMETGHKFTVLATLQSLRGMAIFLW